MEGLDAGADEYLSKPYGADELRARLGVGRRLLHATDQLLEADEAPRVQARTDALAGVPNRRAVLEALTREAGCALDEVPKEVVRRAASVLRPHDVLGRFGGEEFLLVVPGVGAAELAEVLERVRLAVAATPVVALGRALAVTVSLGGALLGGETADAVIARTDGAHLRGQGAGAGSRGARVRGPGSGHEGAGGLTSGRTAAVRDVAPSGAVRGAALTRVSAGAASSSAACAPATRR